MLDELSLLLSWAQILCLVLRAPVFVVVDEVELEAMIHFLQFLTQLEH